MDELIYRQDAIDAVANMLRRKFGIGGSLAEITLADLSSAQPEQRWIPCSKRLPDEKKEVLISAENGLYIAELEIINGREYWSEVMEYRYIENVEAWMPLPEPYKGENDES